MTKTFSTASAAITIAFVAFVGCSPKRTASPPAPLEQELIVLLRDPDAGTLGSAIVTNSSGTVDLLVDGAATQVVASRAPASTSQLAADEVTRIFGDALGTLPPPPRVFNLYFRFDSDELTEQSRTDVQEILRAVVGRPAPDVVAIGHTDTTGAPASNVELGRRRAGTVRNLLVQAGLDPSLVEVTSVGELDLFVPTPDETPEPRNRRVEIAIR